MAAGAATVSLAPILVKAAAHWNVGPIPIAMWRCVFGGALLVVLAGALRQSLVVPRRLALLLVLAGAAFAVDLTVWHYSIFLAGAGMATILGNTQVFFTALLATVFFRERLTRRFLVAAVSALAGLTLLVGVGSHVEFSPDYMRGIGLGLVTGVAYGVFLTLLRSAALQGVQTSTLVRPAWFTVIAALFLVPPAVGGSEKILPEAWPGWAMLVLLALVAQVLGWWAISASVGRVKASIAGLVLMLQPVLATIWSALLFDETLTPLQTLGALVTLAAIYVGSMRRRATG